MTIKFHFGKLILSRDNKVAILFTLNNFISLKKKQLRQQIKQFFRVFIRGINKVPPST